MSEATPRGRLIILSGSSGAGKTTVAMRLLENPRFERVRTATTRAPRGDERDGVDYDFLDEAAFRRGIEGGAFLEHAEVYGHRYGSPRLNLELILRAGRDAVLVIDVQGARTLRDRGVDGHYVFVQAPNPAELRRRLERRGEDDEATIERRLRAAAEESEAVVLFDTVVVNDDVNAAVERLIEEHDAREDPNHR